MRIFCSRLTVFNVVFTLLLVFGCKKDAATPTPQTMPVTVKIETGDPAQDKKVDVKIAEKGTALDALFKASATEGSGFGYKGVGGGEGAFIAEIAGVSAEKPENLGKNWIFYVNGKKANRSAGAYQLSAGDVILWKFEAFNPNQSND